MALNIFPPNLESSQPAFPITIKAYPIYFSIPNTVNLEKLGHIQIRIVYQKNNKTAVNTTSFPDGIIYKSINNIANSKNNIYYVSINSSELQDGWIADTYYKVQLRFGNSDLWDDLSNFSTWKAEQIKLGNFSEWSTVMVLKAIINPTVKILNNSATQSSGLVIESVSSSEQSLTPTFTGIYENEGTETLNKYRFQLYQGNEVIDTSLLEDSGWMQHNRNVDVDMSGEASSSIDYYRFSTILTNLNNYTVVYSIQTDNLFETSSEPYTFTVVESYLQKLEGFNLIAEDSEIECLEEGIINLYLTTTEAISGNYVISRSSEQTNYGVWEDLIYLVFSNEQLTNKKVYSDFTIESGIRYKYAIQQENSKGLRTSPTFEKDTITSSPSRMVDFEYSYLYANGVQLKLKYDNKVSSFKKTQLTSKQDTLGSKYPTILRNGLAYYAEFSLSGLISLNLDENQKFFQIKDDGYYYKDALVIPVNKYQAFGDNNNPLEPGMIEYSTFGVNITNNNIFIERVFREKVLDFLNTQNYLLYKSPTEGNIIVSLMNISLTPNQTLSRMICSFSATAYEVLEFSLNNLKTYQLISTGSFKDIINDERTILLGQISGLFTGQYSKDKNHQYTVQTTPTNLIDLIAEANTYDIGGGYQYEFKQLNSIWIEQYPKIKYTSELNELSAKKAEAQTENDTELLAQIEQRIEEIEKLQQEVLNDELYPIVTLVINGQEISLGANKLYHLRNLNLTTADSIYLKYTGAILLNYTCDVNSVESVSQTVSAVVTSSVWDQLEGIFTATKKILNNYDFYRNLNHINVSNEYNMGLYQSLNVLAAIQEKVKERIAESYNTEFTKYDEESKQWTDGRIYYSFDGITSLEIEADAGTVLLIGKTGSEDAIEVSIGPSEKYVLSPIDNMVNYLQFKDPTYAIINYRCTTTQMTKG